MSYTSPDGVFHLGTAPVVTTAAPGGSQRILPNAQQISRAIAPDSQHREYVIEADDTIEEAFASIRMVEGLIYVSSGVDNGVLQPAAGAAYLGRTRRYLTEVRNSGDEAIPFLISETATSELQSARTFVRGKAGDVLLLVYRTA